MEVEKSNKIQLMREFYKKEGIDLINITSLCEVKLCCSGWGNNINEPEDPIYHVRMYYRDIIIANITGSGINLIDEEKYTVYVDEYDQDFIIFKLCNE